MGLATTVILTLSNFLISLLRKVIPDKVRIPAFIVIIASFVTLVQFLMQAYIPSLYDSLGIFIPLIVVNCIILGRAESYASKNPVLPSIFDGIGMGLGFTVGLTCIGIVREFLGSGTVFGFQIIPESVATISIFVLAPGAFFVLAFLIAFLNKWNMKKAANTDNPEDSVTCKPESCASCTNMMCGGRLFASSDAINKPAAVEEKSENSTSDSAKEHVVEQSEHKADKKIIIPERIARKPAGGRKQTDNTTNVSSENSLNINQTTVSENEAAGIQHGTSEEKVQKNESENDSYVTDNTASENEEHISDDVVENVSEDKATSDEVIDGEMSEDKISEDISETEEPVPEKSEQDDVKNPDEVKEFQEYAAAQKKKQSKKKKKKGGKR
jgi:electron transport complex protein RnfE